MFNSIVVVSIWDNCGEHLVKYSFDCLQGGGDVELSGSPTEKAILNWGIQVSF